MLLIAIFSSFLCLYSTFQPRKVTIDLTPKFLKDGEFTKIDPTSQGILKSKCLPSRSKRIINGEAEVDESSANFHWAVAIFKDDPVHGNLHCTGTLISPVHVLSAAHCLVESTSWNFSPFYVVAGAKCVKEVEECAKVGAKRVIAKVKNAVIPRRHLSKSQNDADLIILLLDTAIVASDHIDFACLPSPKLDLPYEEENFVHWGWGTTSEFLVLTLFLILFSNSDNDPNPAKLNFLKGVSLFNCSMVNDRVLEKDILCSSASRADQGIGNGDSGSGLEYFERDFVTGKHYVVGISSYSYGVIF